MPALGQRFASPLRRGVWLLACFGVSLAAVRAQQTFTVDEVPLVRELDGFVFDPTGALAAERAELARTLEALDRETGAQGYVAYLPSVGEAVPKDFAVELFERLRLGHAGSDFGFLVLVVADQRRAEVEVGYGLERYLTDLLTKRLLDRELVPRMRAGQPGNAVLALVRGIDAITRAGLSGEAPPTEYADGGSTRSGGGGTGLPTPLLAYLAVALLVSLLLAGWLAHTHWDRVSLYDKWRRVYGVTRWWLILLFPVPYALAYPFLRRWLRRLRTAPRFHPETHEPMELLGDYAEIDHLTEGMLAEQEVESAEWDVWATPSREHVQLLRYRRRLHGYQACPECAYETYKLRHTKVLRAATTSRAGLKRQTFRCEACAYEHEAEVSIARKSSSSSSGGGSFGGGGGSGGGFSSGGGSSGGGGAGASW